MFENGIEWEEVCRYYNAGIESLGGVESAARWSWELRKATLSFMSAVSNSPTMPYEDSSRLRRAFERYTTDDDIRDIVDAVTTALCLITVGAGVLEEIR